MPKNSQYGFSMIELMIVVAIIGVLASIALPPYNEYRTRTFNASATTYIKFITTAESSYSVANQVYVATPAGDGPGPNGIIPGTTVPSGVGYVVGVFPVSGTDAVSGNSTGLNYIGFTGHIKGTKVFGVDSTTNGILWRLKKAGQTNPAVDAKSEDTSQELPAGWGEIL